MQLGLVEGHYGTPWDCEARFGTIAALAPHGYRFYIYAPKADDFLRRRWREPHPEDQFARLAALAAQCRENGVSFGIGLSPYELYRAFDEEAQAILGSKLSQLCELGLDRLAILFDDMRGDHPRLAETQAAIVHWIAEHLPGTALTICPSYYSDDPVLDRVFGQRSQNYLETLGRTLDPAIHIFWTGPEVCSRELTPGHLARVAEQLGRKPFLWDNYPVNDGPRMSQFLHLRAFTGRPAGIADHIAGHAVNPALQPVLTRIPALTLSESYKKADAYDHGAAFVRAAEAVCGAELATALLQDLSRFQDTGLDRLEPATREKLRARYAGFDHPAAREIVVFLDGKYIFTGEMA
jgi:hypothetical protein